MEIIAARGGLSNTEIRCLERSLARNSLPVAREQISLVLVRNAEEAGTGWAQAVRTHLYEVDGSNPDLSFQYALHLLEGGEGLVEASRWANIALANRSAWTGAQYAERTHSVYKLRAAIAQASWRAAEVQYSATPDEDSEAHAIAMREATADRAKDWWQYCEETGMNSDTALTLCNLSGGTCR